MSDAPLYSDDLVAMLHLVWGDGFLSPGGPKEVARLVHGFDLKGKTLLDIGCGAGGVDVALVRDHNAGFVTGIDVEDPVLEHARTRIASAGLQGRIGLAKVAPGPLPFGPASFDIVFSKDSIVHIPDKHMLMAEVARVLRPGGWFIASDWLIGHDNPPSPEMQAYLAAEGLAFGMASPARYADALAQAGFTEISLASRNLWYQETAALELARMRGPLYDAATAQLGTEFVDHNIEIWTRMLPVLQSGEHCPTHIHAQKPHQPQNEEHHA
ncbi:MAG: methyltransferase domain-containing protein [Paracoccaceae bacterium]